MICALWCNDLLAAVGGVVGGVASLLQLSFVLSATSTFACACAWSRRDKDTRALLIGFVLAQEPGRHLSLSLCLFGNLWVPEEGEKRLVPVFIV